MTNRSNADEAVIAMLAESIVPESRTPRFEQVEAAIQAAIRDRRLLPGAILPREPDLAAGLGLSRQTVGRALNNLAGRALVTRRRGIGTFVAAKPVEQPLERLYSFVQTLSSEGKPPATQLLGVRLTVDRTASPLLTGSSDGLVVEIGRLFFFDDAPLVLEFTFLPAECGQRLPIDRLTNGVIDDLLREHCGITVDRGEEILSLTKLNRAGAAHLRLRAGAPALLVVRTTLSGERVIQMRRSVIRGDRAQFRVQLAGPALEGFAAELALPLENRQNRGS